MPEIAINGTTVHYQREGSGDPLILIPFLTADHACFAFQLPAYGQHFTCYAVDLRGDGATARGDRQCTMPQFVDDIAAFMAGLDIDRAHILGYSLGGAVAMSFAATHPEKVLSVSLHSTWPKSDAYLKAVVGSWQIVARALDDVLESAITAIFPWCFAPERYSDPDFSGPLVEFVRSRPVQSVSNFIEHTDAIIAHDVLDRLEAVKAPTQISFGSLDAVTSTRFADPMVRAIPHAEVEIFEGCSHAPFFEDVEGFNSRTLAFLTRNAQE